jgi:glycosyltransferase involved in cell wall biosynthesis
MSEVRKISVCLAAFNGSRYIGVQIESILPQLCADDELILIDDGSTDNTLEIVESLQDNRIKIFRNPYNVGPQKSFERAISISTGDLVFLSDQDDIWSKDKVEIVKNFFHMCGAAACVSNAVIVNEDLEVLYDSLFQSFDSGPGFLKNFVKNTYVGCCMAIRSDVIPYILPFPHKIPMHDHWIGLVCEILGEVGFLESKLISYRRHDTNATNMVRFGAFRVFSDRFWLFIGICTVIPKIFRYKVSQIIANCK